MSRTTPPSRDVPEVLSPRPLHPLGPPRAAAGGGRAGAIARRIPRRAAPVAALASAALLAGCGGTERTADEPAASDAERPSIGEPAVAPPPAADGRVTVENCGREATFPSPARRLFVNDGNMISMVLALGAERQVAAVSSLQRDAGTLRRHYGPAVDRLRQAAKAYPGRETVLRARPDAMIAGWNYGYDESRRLTPTTLRTAGIAPYELTEACRQEDGERARGVVDPWTALRTDLTNLGAITDRRGRARELVGDVDRRLEALRDAPQAEEEPTVFVFDSATKAVYTSGRFGAPQAIVDVAGGRNALEDLEDTWTEVSWERVVASKPDAFVFVDYPPQTFAQKKALLRERAGVRDLPAVREERFLNLPYAQWTSGPLNVDAAERTRQALEGWGLVPRSGVRPREPGAR